MRVRIKTIDGGRMPERKTAGAAGFDCYARSVEFDGDWLVYHLGFAIEIPDGHVGLLFLRSSVYRTGLRLPNCVGVIDSDFRGELTARFSFCDDKEDSIPYGIGDRVCQLVIVPIPEVELEESETLSNTERGAKGYGSTGVR